MSNASDFFIAYDSLVEYRGPGGDVVIPDGVTCIRNLAFFKSKNVKTIVIPDSVKTIEVRAFAGTGCANATYSISKEAANRPEAFDIKDGELIRYKGLGGDVVIPAGVKSISKYAFKGNPERLNSVVIPDGVTEIGEKTFDGCINLTKVTIPDSVKSFGKGAFNFCPRIVFEISEEAANRAEYFEIQNNELVKYNGPGGDVIVPTGVTRIGKDAFSFSGVTSVQLPVGITSIGGQAFSFCENLISVTIPMGVLEIEYCAFSYCSNLTNVVFPSTITSIEHEAFEHCDNLKWVSIPKNRVSLIGDPAKRYLGLPFPKLEMIVITKDGDQISFLAYKANEIQSNLGDFICNGQWKEYDLDLINNGPKYKYKLPSRLLGALGRLLDPVELTEENRALFAELLNKNAKKLIPIAEEMNCPEIIASLFSAGVLDEKNVKAVRKLLGTSSIPGLAVLAVE